MGGRGFYENTETERDWKTKSSSYCNRGNDKGFYLKYCDTWQVGILRILIYRLDVSIDLNTVNSIRSIIRRD